MNLTKARKCLENKYSLKVAIHLLCEMLEAIREVHDKGFVHRDIKPANFVMCRDNRKLFVVDFGLSKQHFDSHGNVLPKRREAEFRGTISFASLNTHQNKDMGRRDDIWSFYFTVLDFLTEKLAWR